VGNDCVYIHEFIDIVGHNRPKYMHHMTAVWAPVRREHQQDCLGVWAEVGTTGKWPRVVNIWEHKGWDGLAFHLGFEATGRGDYEPEEAAWWSAATAFRRGGVDRILVPTPNTRTVTQLIDDKVRGAVYAHERAITRAGKSERYLSLVEDNGIEAYSSHGLEFIGAYDNALVNGRECIILWAIPDWSAWASFEAAWRRAPDLIRFRDAGAKWVKRFDRRLLTDSPLNPLVLGRQPHESDRLPFDAI
jgi:hypothetical protein